MPKKKSGSGSSSSGDKKGGQIRQLHVKVKTARGRKSSSTKWLERQLNDPFVAKAKQDGYRSRAAYKLIHIQEKFGLLRPDSIIVDLGCAPGGWLQVATDIAKSGKVIGIDLQEVEPVPGAIILEGDFLSIEAEQQLVQTLGDRKVDVVLSDMAASSCGHPQTDHLRIVALCEAAFEFAKDHLNEGGHFAAKVLSGGTEHELLAQMKKYFKTVKHFKPESSRADSAENFVVAQTFRNPS